MSYKNLEIWQESQKIVVDIRFLIFAIASNDETIDHLETIYETGSLKDPELYRNLHDRIEILGKKLNNFIKSVERNIAKNK